MWNLRLASQTLRVPKKGFQKVFPAFVPPQEAAPAACKVDVVLDGDAAHVYTTLDLYGHGIAPMLAFEPREV